jgi:hypothetical protein
MARVFSEQFVVGIGELADGRRQRFVSYPKFCRCEMLHSWRDCPARCAARASSASLSSFPASASRPIAASNRAASNASYQARNRARSPGGSRSMARSISSVVIAEIYHSCRSGERADSASLIQPAKLVTAVIDCEPAPGGASWNDDGRRRVPTAPGPVAAPQDRHRFGRGVRASRGRSEAGRAVCHRPIPDRRRAPRPRLNWSCSAVSET